MKDSLLAYLIALVGFVILFGIHPTVGIIAACLFSMTMIWIQVKEPSQKNINIQNAIFTLEIKQVNQYDYFTILISIAAIFSFFAADKNQIISYVILFLGIMHLLFFIYEVYKKESKHSQFLLYSDHVVLVKDQDIFQAKIKELTGITFRRDLLEFNKY